jgi:hypothetical protein
MSKNLLVRQSVFVSRRLFATTSFNLDNRVNEAKPFSEVPALSGMKIVTRSLPGGKFFNKSMSELHLIMNAEFGNILKFAGLFGRPPMVFVYDAKDFEKVLISLSPNDRDIAVCVFSICVIGSENWRRLARENCTGFTRVLPKDQAARHLRGVSGSVHSPRRGMAQDANDDKSNFDAAEDHEIVLHSGRWNSKGICDNVSQLF